MLERFRNFLVVVEEGSLNKASRRLHLTQPSLTRQIQALEQDLGGPLLERQPSGVKPTALGMAAIKLLRPITSQFDDAIADLRRQSRGQRDELRIGYLGSAAQIYLTPALTKLRALHPEAKVKLLDLTPAEQMGALAKGEIDLALIGQEGATESRDYYARKLATLSVCAALPAHHPLAQRGEVRPADLRHEHFIGAPETEVPGRNLWITRICRRAGFRPKFIADGQSIGEVFSLVASEGAVTLLPSYFSGEAPPGVVLVPVVDNEVTWDLLLLWQRGRASHVLRAMIDLLAATASGVRNESQIG
jgi:DNA-binding transcriptional LysR family regulator